MMKTIIALMLMAMICGASFVLAIADGDPPKMPSGQQAPAIADQAFALALKYTGFSSQCDFDAQNPPEPEIILLLNDQTPFVHDNINGHHIWSVLFNNIDLRKIAADTSPKTSIVHNFQVLLDSADGCLLRISTIAQRIDSNIAPVKSAVDAEAQMLSSGDVFQVYDGPAPKISFLQALDACRHSPRSAKQIDAVLLMYSRPGYARYQTPRLVWFITLRGIPPIYFHPPRGTPQPPISARNFIHEIIDATTGRGLFATTVPTPAPWK
jgi:hypothetical protein